MKIEPNQIESKAVAGKTKSGEPVVYIRTHGGLHAMFKRAKDGSVESIAASPHIAITKWMAEKKESGIEWDNGFDTGKSLKKSEDDLFKRMRNLVFAPVSKTEVENPDENCLVYNFTDKSIQILNKGEIKEFACQVSNSSDYLVRDLAMNSTVQFLQDFASNLTKADEDRKKQFAKEGTNLNGSSIFLGHTSDGRRIVLHGEENPSYKK